MVLSRIPVVITENVIQTMLVRDFPIPEPLTAQKIRNVDVQVQQIETEIIDNKIIVQGIVHKQIFFLDSNDLIRELEENIPFSEMIDLPGAAPGMDVLINPIVEHVRAQLIANGQIIHQKVVLQIFAKLVDLQEVTVQPGVGSLFNVDQIVGSNFKQTLITENLSLDLSIEKIEEVVAKVIDLNIDVIPNKVIVQGTLDLQIFYIAEDGVSHHQGFLIPFGEFIDLLGVTPGMEAEVIIDIESIVDEIIGPNQIHLKILLQTFVEVTRTIEIPLAIGNGPLVLLARVIGTFTKQHLNESTAQLDRTAIKIQEIQARIQNLDITLINNKVVLKGIIHKQIFYVGTDQIEYHQAENVPFAEFIDAPGALPFMNTNLDVQIETIIPKLSSDGNELTQKIILALSATITEDIQVPLGPTAGQITGKVKDDKGRPVKGALVKAVNLEDPSQSFIDLTDEDGSYSLFLPDGTFRIFVLCCGPGCFTTND